MYMQSEVPQKWCKNSIRWNRICKSKPFFHSSYLIWEIHIKDNFLCIAGISITTSPHCFQWFDSQDTNTSKTLPSVLMRCITQHYCVMYFEKNQELTSSACFLQTCQSSVLVILHLCVFSWWFLSCSPLKSHSHPWMNIFFYITEVFCRKQVFWDTVVWH